ncbi:hypothetical protein RHMOL_Rhmol11G0040200 [Rhododendron molle]|uniref:Uncharacterized protein n=1 Tax=Rhododendron molle TaxID=49168 RepID=A0ACC0LNN8_RHOML|nr:hypothetical protein RHMOL_Rhmol11G0040200 [Rhododendron molle]
MPRVKHAAKKPPRGPVPDVATSSRQPDVEEGDEILWDVEEEEEMMADPEQEAQSLGLEHICVQRISAQGLAYFFIANPGYIKGLVADFYKNMKVPELGKMFDKGARITSKIANFASRDEINQALYTNPAEATRPHVPRKFKDEYRLINQFVHYNLNRRGTENKPTKSKGEMLYAFMEPGNVIDWAKYIFRQMVEFKANGPTYTRMPYPCMTRAAGAEGVPGGSYLTTMPPKGVKQSVWQKLFFCQGVETMNSHRKLKKEIRENAKRQARIDHKEGSTSEPYAPPPIEEAEDSDDFGGEEPESDDE